VDTRLGLRLSSAVVTAAVVVSTASAAYGAVVTVDDRVGDAAAKYDIVRVTYRNDVDGFRFRMKLRDIRRRSGILAIPKILTQKDWSAPWFAVVSGARRNGTRFHRLEYYSGSESRRVPCPGMTGSVDFARDVVTASVPQACLGDYARRSYVAFGLAATPGMSDAGDQTRFRWVPYD
jgi:hypothetical protein